LARTLNLGILAHVDAGKTTLTERLLFAAGVIDTVGSVDAGTTTTDSLALERERGITIRSAVASLRIGETTVNIIDTPGHPDFIAEVDRVLGVLDGAVLVVSAVEGVQPQTRLLMRALRRLRVPTLMFINKIDRGGADTGRTLAGIARRLDVPIVPMSRVRDAGTREADVESATAQLIDVLTESDDELLAVYVADESALTGKRLRAELAGQTAAGRLCPVFAGSAMTGAGIPALMAGLIDLLPAAGGDPTGPLSGRIFKIERGTGSAKVAFLRVFDGVLRLRDHPTGGRDRVTALHVLVGGAWQPRDLVAAGEIAAVRGLSASRVGDLIGAAHPDGSGQFAPPMIEARVVPVDPADGAQLRTALGLFAEQDPLINVRADEAGGSAVALYGEVQKEVIQATLYAEFGIATRFDATTTLCVERPAGVGQAIERLNTPSNPYHATIGLRIEPAPPGTGIEVRVDVGYRVVPLYVYRTVDIFVESMQEYVRDALAAGRFGWPVTDCVVTMTDSGYSVADGPPSLRGPTTTAADFRKLTPVVLARAVAVAGTVVCEPLARLTLDVPTWSLGPVLRELSRLGAALEDQLPRGDEMVVIAVLTAAAGQRLHQLLPKLTGGEGVLEPAFAGYRAVRGRPPRRATRPRE
jgi:ribosomal protection tetracycline resistance protein